MISPYSNFPLHIKESFLFVSKMYLSAMATLAPFFNSCIVNSLPIPLPAPVTTITFP